MLFNQTYSKKQRQILKLVFSLVSLCSFVFLVSSPGYSEEEITAENSLPSAPDTGTPEEDFEAGGTRDNHQLLTICGENTQQIAYLLGQNNRDFTLDSHPTFWFYIPSNLKNIANLEFKLTEVATGKKIYAHSLEMPKNDGLVGLSIPQDPQYALSHNVNYNWSLNIKCAETNEDPEFALAGWVHRLPLNSDLQNQLATVSKQEKYQVYLEEDVYYDALNNLVQLHIAEPNNPEITIAWNQLLATLGQQHLIQDNPISFYVLAP